MKKIILVVFSVIFILINGNLVAQTINGSFESKFKRYQKNESFTGTPTQEWDAVAWKGERINKQIVLWSDVDINSISYTVSDLSNGQNLIASSNIKLRFGKYVKGDPEARSCSQYPTHPTFVEIADALSNTEITAISSSDPIKIWVSIDIPSTALAGNYTGTITLNNGVTPLVFIINMIVVDYTLPDVNDWDFHLDIWQFPVNILEHYNTANSGAPIAVWSDEHFELLKPFYTLLANSGQKAITTYIKDGALGYETMIKWIKKTDGSWVYDFTVFDKYVETLISWGITKQIDCFSPVGWNEAIIPYWDEALNSTINLSAPLGSVTYNTRWDDFLTAFKTHLDNKGWFDKTVLYLDEVSEDKLLNVASVVHGNNPNWKLGIAYSHALSNDSKTNFYDLSGILEAASNNGISDNKISTFYTSCTQTTPNNYVTPENSPAEMTWMGWHATREGYAGYLRWAFDNWKLNDPFDARDGAHTSGDFSMVYRASNNSPSEALSSIRFEMLRDGIQDYEKIKILRASLEGSSKVYDQEVLKMLNAIINNFGKDSGGIAEQLIIQGQNILEEIVLGTVTYCEVGGGINTGYHVKSLTSTGGINNFNFTTNQYPTDGYEHYEATKLTVHSGDNVTLNLENSTASNCVRTKVWIDWNNDQDFEDVGEEVFSGGDQGSCSNSIIYSVPIIVPSDIKQGIKRMRIQLRDSFEDKPTTCGIYDKTSTSDFDVEVMSMYCSVTGTNPYNANAVLTIEGTSNINYVGAAGVNNYEDNSSSQKVTVAVGNTFNLSVTNSNGYSRSIVWIDWNHDNDFDDTGEQLAPLSSQEYYSGEGSIAYDIDVTVPISAKLGETIMRILTGDAWTYNDTNIPTSPCGAFLYCSFKDFSVEVTNSLGLNKENKSYNPKVYPNPFKNRLTIKIPELNTDQVNISVVDILGRIVYNKKYYIFHSPQVIELPCDLNNGTYFLKLNGYTCKLIKNQF